MFSSLNGHINWWYIMIDSIFILYRMLNVWRKFPLVYRSVSRACVNHRKVKYHLLRTEYHWKAITERVDIGLLVCKHISYLTSKELIDAGEKSPLHMNSYINWRTDYRWKTITERGNIEPLIWKHITLTTATELVDIYQKSLL